jgi:concanavalin A-like lectin/glucanase superfamily protein
MITKGIKTSRRNFVVPQQPLLGLLVLSAWVLTSAMPVFGEDGGPRCTAAPPNLVGWWPGDGNEKDITPADHDGTRKDDGGDLSTDTRFTTGEVAQAFLFDADRDYVQIPTAPGLNIPSGKVSVDAWIYITGYKYYPSVLGKGDVGPTYKESYALFVDPSGHAGFLVNRDGSITGRALVIGSTVIPLNKWTLLAGTYDGTSVHVYVNGSLEAASFSQPATTGAINKINPTGDDVLIGKAHRTVDPNGDTYFNGRIDEVELFSRSLGQPEIQAIYAANTLGKCKCQEKPAEAEGDVQDDDGHKSNVSMTAKRECDDNGEVDYKDDTGKEMHGKHKSIAMSGNKAIVSGHGNLLDGTPVDYTAVLVGNQPLIGSLFSMTWTTATGEIFQRAGVMTNGGYVVVPQQQ